MTLIQEIPEGIDGDLIASTYNNGRGVDWMPLTEENWEREIEQIPLFMTSAPTEEAMENNEVLQAIQSLVYDGTPEEIAANFKEQGNEIVREKQRVNYKSAITFYTKALDQKCNDKELNAACYINRALVNIELQNYGSAVRDCQKAIRLGELPGGLYSKALFRLCKAFMALDKLEEAKSALDHGLQSDGGNAAWKELQVQLNEKIQKAEQRREKSEMERKRRRDGVDALINAISQRGVRVAGGLENARFANGSSQITEFSPSMLFPIPDNVDLKPTYTDGSLCWPVCLVYPQLETWDLISDWHEQTNVKTQLDTVLTSERDDLSEEYSVNWSNNLAIYIPVEIKGKKLEWKRIALFQSLQTVLTLQGAVVAEDGIVRLWIMPKPVKGGWTEQWLSNSL